MKWTFTIPLLMFVPMCVTPTPMASADDRTDAALAIAMAEANNREIQELNERLTALESRCTCGRGVNAPRMEMTQPQVTVNKQIGDKVYACGPNGCVLLGTVVESYPQPLPLGQPVQAMPVQAGPIYRYTYPATSSCPTGNCPMPVVTYPYPYQR